MKTITIIGHYCATGGISIHIRRLSKLLVNNFKVKFIDESRLEDSDGKIFNLRNKEFFTYLKIIKKSDIIHVHSSVPVLRFFHVLIGRFFFKKIFLTIHSLSTVKTWYGFYFLRFTSFLSDEIIVVSEELKLKLKLRRCHVIPAFIPPIIEDELNLPQELLMLIKNQKNAGKKLIVSNAYRLNFHNNHDLYGLDLIVDVAQKAKDSDFNIFLIFVITSLEINYDIFLQYRERIKKNHLESHIFIYTKPISFIKLILESDLVIRATNTDGDAITIREAIYFNTPIIASDVVNRPKNTILFKNRDSCDLFNKIKQSINVKNILLKSENIDYSQIYLNVFKIVL